MDFQEVGWRNMDWIDLSIGMSGWLLWMWEWTFGFHKMLRISCLAEELLAFQETSPWRLDTRASVYRTDTLLYVFVCCRRWISSCVVRGTYLYFLYRIYAYCKIYLDTLYKVDNLASFIGQIDLLASCAVYADILYRVSRTSQQHVYDTYTAKVSEFFFVTEHFVPP
jgi:hypothetical protein